MQTHGKLMANSWQSYDMAPLARLALLITIHPPVLSSVARVGGRGGRWGRGAAAVVCSCGGGPGQLDIMRLDLSRPWQSHGKVMAKSWQNHGTIHDNANNQVAQRQSRRLWTGAARDDG